MADFDWSRIQPAETLELSRAFRFKPEWRPLLLDYLGIRPGMSVLEVGCGPGTFATYLAEGIAAGRVTGLDLDARFIERARQKAQAAGVKNVEYVVGSAYDLPFPSDSFDAVTSYTGIGVLKDPERALAEMIRVCHPGGHVSLMEAVTGPWGIFFEGVDTLPGHATYPKASRYQELQQKAQWLAEELLRPRQELGSKPWPAKAFFALLGYAGLEEVRLNAWGYAHGPDDLRISPEHRRHIREAQHQEERQWLTSLRGSEEGRVLAEHGFGPDELEELIALSETRFRWLLENPLYDWEGGVSIAVAGRKPADFPPGL